MEKYWHPNQKILELIENYCKVSKFTNILEVGPGSIPFKLATYFVDNVERENSTILDIDTQRFNFEDGHFDFTYCRHVFEDIQNPDFAFRELQRVSKIGYIETPSPLVECLRQADFTGNYRGYIHHRYIIWSEKDTIFFLPKFPIIEHLNFNEDNLKKLAEEPLNWNNYFFWNSNSKFVIFKHGLNFNIVSEYESLINRAVVASLENNIKFINNLTHS